MYVLKYVVVSGSNVTHTQSALEGTLNVLRQSVKAGVHKVVLTSSWATTLDRM